MVAVAQGDQYRRLYPERNVLDKPCDYGVYSLKLKQRLLDALHLDREEKRAAAKEMMADTTSTGLASRLHKVPYTLYIRKRFPHPPHYLGRNVKKRREKKESGENLKVNREVPYTGGK